MEAFNRRDRDAMLDAFAPDIVWRVPGDNPLAGAYEGRDAVWNDVFAPLWDAPPRIQIHDVLGQEEYAVALTEVVTGENSPSFRLLEVARIADGMIAERWAYIDRQNEVDELLKTMVQHQSA
ncbi:MAG: nuclear transport factor 2 family protein [Acidimicrobiales bacterium]